MYKYLEKHDLIGFEQKGCRALTRGTKDHLMLDKAIMKDSRYRKINLAMVWIDYQKAYDMLMFYVKAILIKNYSFSFK